MKEGTNLMVDLGVDERMLLTCVRMTEVEEY